jgi:hypothetical protein
LRKSGRTAPIGPVRDSFLLEPGDHPVEIGDPCGEMAVSRIQPAFPQRFARMDDQMKLLTRFPDAKPGAREVEIRPLHLLKSHDIAVERTRALQISHQQADMVNAFDFHPRIAPLQVLSRPFVGSMLYLAIPGWNIFLHIFQRTKGIRLWLGLHPNHFDKN